MRRRRSELWSSTSGRAEFASNGAGRDDVVKSHHYRTPARGGDPGHGHQPLRRPLPGTSTGSSSQPAEPESHVEVRMAVPGTGAEAPNVGATVGLADRCWSSPHPGRCPSSSARSGRHVQQLPPARSRSSTPAMHNQRASSSPPRDVREFRSNCISPTSATGTIEPIIESYFGRPLRCHGRRG